MPDFDPRTPNIARVYDALIGGRDNFASDRSAASVLAMTAPCAVDIAAENKNARIGPKPG